MHSADNPGETKTLTFTDANFDADVLLSGRPVLVDVWAEGCSGCRRLAPLIDVIASEYAGKAKVGKLDAMSNLNTAMRYQVRMLPTLLLFKNGRVVWQRPGVMDKDALQKLLDPHL
jgi:thioredoxin 1